MDLIFGKRTVTAMAEVLENGQKNLNAATTGKSHYHTYESTPPEVNLKVRVSPYDGPAFEAQMKTDLSVIYLLKAGTRVHVKYDPRHGDKVIIDDDSQAILVRNPQLIKLYL